MEQSKRHFEASSSFFLVYIEVIVLLSCCNLLCLNLLGSATAVRGNDTDLEALLHFKAEITGDRLGVMALWNSSIHFCQWQGVTCGRKHQRVTKLAMQFLKLSGPLSPYIGNLSFLRELNLAGNNFYNHIPQEIGRLRRLETLKLTNNSISGQIPHNLSACSKLSFVHTRGNKLSGKIPDFLGFLPNLKVLSLVINNFSGIIPPSLGNLSSLEVLALTENALTGIIPESLGHLKNLSYFSVLGNAISGTVPVTMFKLSNIRLFDIGQNKIQGTLHIDLEITMPYVEFFSIGGNQISGQIPVSISNASNLNVLQFNENNVSGNVPSLEKLDKLFQLLLDENHLGHGREGDLKFLCTLVNDTKLENIGISENNFGGVFPECISNFSKTVSYLAIEQNKILGRIPDGIGNLINLEVLVASQNRLSGPIPFSIGRLPRLNIFFSHTNFLSGVIPQSIGNLSMLTGLALDANNLQGIIPASIGKCQNLLRLGLSHNNLSGTIPPEILGLSSLSIELDLSSNFLTGELPVAVEKLKNLGEFDVSQNSLSGFLPENLGSCVSLEKLYLDGNFFEGPIPSSFSSLKGLVVLDVADNNLSGRIPEFVVSFRSLRYLNLSFNDFEGEIPSGGVFKNASLIFVEGNKRLCGGIHMLHLSKCKSKTSSNSSLRVKLAIGVVILGVTLVFTCLLIIMWFRKKKYKKQTTTCAENSLLQLSYQSILRATDGFSTQNLVGSGSFGSVYKGILEVSGLVIAVKVLHLLNRGASRSFLAECEALKNIRHRNLIKVLTAISGVDYQGNDFKALVYDFMVNGSLEEWLHPSISMNELETARYLNFFQRVNLTIDIAHALEYLHHGCGISIIHCDLKPSNILLDEEMLGHISDFGLAKIISADVLNSSVNQSSSLGLRGTIGYTPPEYGMGSELSTKGDVYSYDILLLEMFTGKRPTDERFKEDLSLHDFVEAALPGRVFEVIDPILLQERVENDKHLRCLNLILEIGLTCSAESPNERMDMSDVVAKLCSIRDELHSTRSRRQVIT
ncbi:probable LRR receptor-like serine/threonine-protein kinase At3g47570 [Hibiscus syriacus]|uniref:probable LRR receptor-like serine/threonine-protein kinase At3g47570 n=1 Tax=Hibiscus syriacus TaxID=106335 RepID=UPI00192186EA|nr:probable LRR receptor-like serine/threonine-protein kinase At3g47570 [Hibiscus syriacus]